MLIANLADLHITQSPAPGGYSLDEQVEQLVWIGQDAADRGARALLAGGDLLDGANGGRPGTIAERNAAMEIVGSWTRHFPVVITTGNHDHPGDLRFLEQLRTEHAVHVVEEPQTIVFSFAAIGCMPWPRKALLARMSKASSGLELDQQLLAGLKAVLVGYRWPLDLPRMLLGHAELGSAVLDNGQPVAGRCAVPISEHDLLASDADVVLLGHIHKHQVLAGGRIVYTGAPRPMHFGEAGPHGYCMVEVGRGTKPEIEHIEAPGRKMLTIEGEWFGQELTNDGADIVDCAFFNWVIGTGFGAAPIPELTKGHAVRLVYEVPESERKAAAEQAEAYRRELLGAGAHSVRVAPSIKTTHVVRNRAIVQATTMAERLKAEWASRGSEPARANEILAKLEELQDEHHD